MAMTKRNSSASPVRVSGIALVLGAVLLAAGVPAQAQWLVQDNKLYDLIKQKVIGEQLKPLNDKLKISGKGVAPYSGAGQPDDDADTFNQLNFPLSPNTLLAPGKNNFDTYVEDAKKYIGEMGSGPNCNPEEGDKRSELFNNCLNARNIMGSQLHALRTISQTLEARNRKLHKLMENNEYKTIAELQKKQYEISALQAMMLNDMARIQTIQTAFNTTRDMYHMRKEEEEQAKATGKKALGADGKEKKGSPDADSQGNKAASRAALIASLHAAANADNNKKLKDRSSVAGSAIEKIIEKGLGFLAK